MLTKLTISFTPEERRGLQEMAETEMRPPKEQLRWVLRRELQRRGLWPAELSEQQRGEQLRDAA